MWGRQARHPQSNNLHITERKLILRYLLEPRRRLLFLPIHIICRSLLRIPRLRKFISFYDVSWIYTPSILNSSLCINRSRYNDQDDTEIGFAADCSTDDPLLPGKGVQKRNRFQSRLKRIWSARPTRVIRETMVGLLAIWGFVSVLLQTGFWYRAAHLFDVEQPSPCFCGYSVAEAISMGCKYDSLSAAWLPPHCRDDELTEEFERSGPGPNGSWVYWADKEHMQELTLYEVSLYADRQPELFHTSLEWHRKHCIWSWLKEHRSKSNGVIYDPRSDTEAHIRHCGKMLMEFSNGTTSGVVLIS